MQDKKLRKVYYCAKQYEADGLSGIVFEGQDGTRLYWAGGSKDTVKFILQKLIEKYGNREGIEIYRKYNEALLEISEEDTKWKFPKAPLVLYRQDHEGRHEKKKGLLSDNENADMSTESSDGASQESVHSQE